ncbi:MAG: Spy/CpxP family protein refolding chaperone [Bryobacteraceae bacterium]|nr:Spy/CpxP family protein refolding chaperone [Bryobacteraceae bacterium]
MKQTLTAITGLLLTAGLIFAQGPRLGGRPGGGNVEERVDRLAQRLTLTDAQKTQATTIFTAAETAADELEPKLAAARTAINDAVKANAAASQIDSLSAAYGTLVGQMTAIHSKAQASFYALLTTEQKAIFDGLRNGRGPRGSGGRE